MQSLPQENTGPVADNDLAACLRVLQVFANSPDAIAGPEELERLIARIYKRNRKDRRRLSRDHREESDRETVASTGRIQVETSRSASEQPMSALHEEAFTSLKSRSQRCYICHQPYRLVHHFYHSLCPDCAESNFRHRSAVADLTGRRALVTGGRIKIGYQTALKLLRCGTSVVVTTRFPRAAATRYSAEPDFASWSDRLQIHQADFRDVPGLLRFVDRLTAELPALEILINNAAQSVRNSAEYVGRLQELEATSRLCANQTCLIAVEEGTDIPRTIDALATSPIASSAEVLLDRHGELVDDREQHSWTHRLAEVEPVDLLETLLINANAPCLLASQLKPLLLSSPFADRYIVNVTGLDGQFSRSKSVRHPHVNMSNAALNMLTRTAADDYIQSGIMMNSVDTGWITHVASHSRRKERLDEGFVPPLDEIDGAARILDPVFRGIQGERLHGQLFRHYQPSDW